MLDLAINYRDKLISLYISTYMDLYFDTYHCGSDWLDDPFSGEGNERVFVSLDKDGNILGFIRYQTVKIGKPYVSNIGVMNFTQTRNRTFSMDVLKVIDDIFTKYNFNKIVFSSVADAPHIGLYEKGIKSLNGHRIGVCHDECMLGDNTIHDLVVYEIMRKDYLESKMYKRIHK